jgi:ATP-binding cassette subfamily F protein 3
MALNEFEGTVMLVSHDRALLRAVCDEFWMVSRGGVEPFDGDLDDYQRYLLDEAKRQREEAKEAAKAPVKPVAATPIAKSKGKGDTSPKTRKELQDVEARMQALNDQGAALESRLSTNPHPSEIAEIGRNLKLVNDEIAQLEDRWLDLSSRVETTGA